MRWKALQTVRLAQAVERLGYRRFWVAEHHNLANFAGTSPEILIGQIAARTERIRVGSGGVMLPHYSAFKVAEVFRMLETLFPGRIDLGIGRAPKSVCLFDKPHYLGAIRLRRRRCRIRARSWMCATIR